MAEKYFTELATGGARGGLSDSELEQGFEKIEDPPSNLPWRDKDVDRKTPNVPPYCFDPW